MGPFGGLVVQVASLGEADVMAVEADEGLRPAESHVSCHRINLVSS